MLQDKNTERYQYGGCLVYTDYIFCSSKRSGLSSIVTTGTSEGLFPTTLNIPKRIGIVTSATGTYGRKYYIPFDDEYFGPSILTYLVVKNEPAELYL